MDASAITALDYSRLGPPEGTRVAIVGGCGGIGRALVNACLETGLKVAVLDLPSSLQRHAPPETCLQHAIDATDEESVNAAFGSVADAWGGLDVMVNLCGFTNEFEPVANMTAATWDEITNGNLRSAFLCARAALPLLKTSERGAIINTASGLAYKGLPGTAPYGAAKAGVIALSKSLANENAPDIRVNVIAPGAVDTAFLRGGTSRTGDDENHATHIDTERYADATPMKRLAVTDDVVAPILFLSGDAARFITGQVIHINGGGYMP
ncbi:MAG: SDR family oxidoreductase [Rhodospirillaceae bacterium]|nr:SDR family oxidoreductase [Rhodospirillaceae bacterium]